MNKIKYICSSFIFLFVCFLFYKPVFAETVATDRQGYRVYAGDCTNCIGYFDTRTGKVKTVYYNNSAGWFDDIENLCYYKGYFYIDSANGDFYRVTKKGKISRSYGSGERITVYKNKIYYIKDNSIRRCSLKGKKKTVLIKRNKNREIKYFTILKGRLHYIVVEGDGVNIYSSRLSGKYKRKVCCISSEDDEVWTWPQDRSYYRSGNAIYFIEDADGDHEELAGIYRYTVGNSRIKQVCSLNNYDGHIVGVKNKKLYFTRWVTWDTYYFCSVPVSGGSYKNIQKMGTKWPLMGKGNYCMFYKNNKWYSMKLNGKNVKRVKPEFFY